MTARSQLESYLDGARRRLRWILSARGAVLLLAGLLLVTSLAALLLWRFAFSAVAVWSGRALLVLVLAGVALWFALRWRALRGVAGANTLDRALPGQAGRVATYLEESNKPGGSSPLIGLLAQDALQVAEQQSITRLIPARRIWLPVLGALAALALFVVLFGSRSPVGEGARQLWAGQLPPAVRLAAAEGGIAVKPGDTTMRRNQDLPISAQVLGNASDVQVHVRFDGSDAWEIAPMQRGATGGYAFTLYAVRDDAHYYVTAGHLKSSEHRIKVVDLPAVEKLRLTYDYPKWTGLAQHVQDGGADIRAVAGTEVGLEVVTSAPLQGPLLVIDGNGKPLAQSGMTSRGQLAVNKDGHYRIATRFLGEVVALTPDYVIAVAPDEKPEVRVVRPGKDYRATSIEEVPVRVEAHDDYRLEALELHYSVNGGDWRSESLPAGSADIQAAAMLRMEALQKPGPNGEAPLLVPGDLVSYYALARDHTHSVQTDLFLIQIQPFEQRYTQSQAGGGGGGGGGGDNDDANISKRQKEVLLATWNLQRNQDGASGREAERNADNARMLADVQNTLAGQATTLVERAKAREITGQDATVNQYLKSMEDAAKAMDPAAKNLTDMKLTDAVKYEQQALQLLLRAESAFRDIQVAMRSQGGGGGGGGGSQAGRDVSEMTELELDLAKNQYETEQQVSQQQQGGANSEAQDDMMRRLAELARRQEQMARDTASQKQLTEAQKWQQEQLRREAEQLQQQLQQLAQQQPGSQQGSPQGSQQGSQQSGSQSSAAAQAAQQVAQALQQMQSGGSQNQQRASEQLNRAREQMQRGQQQADSQRFSGLARDADDLATRQRESERELRAAIDSKRQQNGAAGLNQQRDSGLTYEQMDKMAAERRQLQEDLQALQQHIDSTRQQNLQQSPRASGQLAQARKELEDMDTAEALARSASDIERGRGVQAATNDPVISDTLQRLQQNLATAADTAVTESGARQQSRKADATDLLAELGELRRALDRAREQALAQNQSGSGDPGARSPDARDGQRGQAGGQSGQQGQGGQGQGGQQGQSADQRGQPGQRGGENGNAAGGSGTLDVAGNDSRYGGAGGGSWSGGLRVGSRVAPLNGAEREALRNQTQLSAERLAQLRGQLANGVLTAPDSAALIELEKRLRLNNVDPMSAEYQNMTTLVSQLELAALKAQQQTKDGSKSTHVDETVDDSRQYRDNVAEYYRRLGGGND